MKLAYNAFWLNHGDMIIEICFFVLIIGCFLAIGGLLFGIPKDCTILFVGMCIVVASGFSMIYTLISSSDAKTFAQTQTAYKVENVPIAKYSYPDGSDDLMLMHVNVLTKDNKTIQVNALGSDNINVKHSMTVKKSHLVLKKYTIKNKDYLKKHGLYKHVIKQYYDLTINKPEKTYDN